MNDCWRKCIARISGTPVELVPDFVNINDVDWLADTCAWLEGQGMAMVALMPLHLSGQGRLDTLALGIPPFIAVGPSKRTGSIHAVVVDKGNNVYDPEEGGMALASVEAVYWIVALR